MLSVLSVPTYIFYFSGNSSSDHSLKYILAAFSLGNIGQSQYACNSAQLSDRSLSLFCNYGTLYGLSDFGQTLASNNVSCKNDGNNFLFTPSECHIKDAQYSREHLYNLQYAFYQKCFGHMNCSLELYSSVVPSNCTGEYEESQLVYFAKAMCKSEDVNLFLLNRVFLPKESIAMIVVVLDLLVGVLILAQFAYIRLMQTVTAREINEQVVTARDFAVQIKGLPQHEDVRELKAQLWVWVEQVLATHEATEVNPLTNKVDTH